MFKYVVLGQVGRFANRPTGIFVCAGDGSMGSRWSSTTRTIAHRGEYLSPVQNVSRPAGMSIAQN